MSWHKLAVYGDGTIKLTTELMTQLGLVPGEGGAICVATGKLTKNGFPTDENGFVVTSMEILTKIAPEEAPQAG